MFKFPSPVKSLRSKLASIASLVAAFGLLCLGPQNMGVAAPVSRVINVVKIISFDCSVCLQSEGMDAPIQQLVEGSGGKFIVAPIPRGDNTNIRERFYYVLRDLGPSVETRARASLFKGAQGLNYPLAEVADTLDWLRQDMGEEGIKWDDISAQVQNSASEGPITRALRLVASSGAQITPTYVLVRSGQVVATLDINSVPGANLSALREAVLQAVRNAYTKQPEGKQNAS